MSLDPLTAALDVGKTLLDKFIPDKDAANKAKSEYELAILNADVESRKDQAAINQAEASSSDPFTSRARPTIIYICGLGLIWAYFLSPLLGWFSVVFHWTQQPPEISTEGLTTLLLSILGLGALRTAEKLKGAQNMNTGG